MQWEVTKLSNEHANVIRATLPLVGEHIEEITKLFYKTMFSNHPDLIKNLFNRGNQKQGAQQKALAASVATFASMLVNDDAPLSESMLSRIGHKHATVGVTEDQYQIVHDNLFAAIVQVLGADVVTKDVAEAWDHVFWIMGRLLIKFEKDLYAEAGVEPGKVFRQVKVVACDTLAEGVTHFTIESTEASKPLPGHKPGQYISVRAHLPDGAGQLRQYSLTDAGKQSHGRLTFAVQAVKAHDQLPAGEVSNWLLENVKQGSELEISLPFGDLVLDEQSNSPVVLISAGIGATPMISMLSRLALDKSEREVVVFHADSSAAADAFASQTKHLASQLPNCRFHTWYAQGEPNETTTVGDRLDLTKETLPSNAQYYLCGSTAFLQACSKDLESLSVPASHTHYELFTPNDWLLK